MKSGSLHRGLTGLAAGAILGAALLGVFALGSLAGLPNAAFVVFEWLVRVLPGRLVISGLETTLRVLEGLGLNIKDTSKTVEEALALTGLFVTAALAGLAFFTIVRPGVAARVLRRGAALGIVAGVAVVVIMHLQATGSTFGTGVVDALWFVAVFLLWGWALARVYVAVCPEAPAEPDLARAREAAFRAPRPPAAGPAGAPSSALEALAARDLRDDASRIDRRHFIIRVGGVVATFVVLGAEVAEIRRVAGGPHVLPAARAPIPFRNAGSPVKPVPGTRPEYTPVPDFYRVDIDLTPPQIDAASWRLRIGGMAATALALTLDQIKSGYPMREEFITLECISNPVGGPLIGTTLWSGPSFRDVLADAHPLPAARYAHILSQDGFDEVVDLTAVEADPRILLAYAWNGQPLPTEHGFPLRVYVPDVYGMKQPKWITEVVLVPDFIPGYWVRRGWDSRAQRRTTSVIDTVATGDLVKRGGRTFVPVGGIADAGARGISRVEIQVDGGAWQPAELRKPLSRLTWVIWRYEWPWQQGEHVFAVRAYDGQGILQTTAENPPFPKGATGIDTKNASILPG
jgi:DMSO/TMAO reductase YedYZ molybdopterin-dependent catalytic subunit